MAEILQHLVPMVRYSLSEKSNIDSSLTDSKFEEKVDTSSAPAPPDTPKIGASNEVVAQVSMSMSIQYCLDRRYL
jgi:hypothetical protein